MKNLNKFYIIGGRKGRSDDNQISEYDTKNKQFDSIGIKLTETILDH